MKILVTGAAGFVGYHVAIALLKRGDEVVGLDNINDYYDVSLKYHRLEKSGIAGADVEWNKSAKSSLYPNYRFIRMGLENKPGIMGLCEAEQFDIIINMAAQAGVRYSIQNPDVYVESNVVGFLNILEACRNFKVRHLVYASSSSVYGLNEVMPFSAQHSVAHPVSLYAATKKTNELMAHTYSHLYRIPTSGLRFFTVYGPMGRPDMAYFLFADAILQGKPIKVFNHGKMKRDFTYIDDIVAGVINVADSPAEADGAWSGENPDPSRSTAPYRIYNIGNNQPVELMAFIKAIEGHLGKDAIMDMQDIQAGDVPATWANVDDLINSFNYKPDTPISEGTGKFVEWYKSYYNV